MKYFSLAAFKTFLLFFSPSFLPSPSLLPPSLPSAFSFIDDWLWFVLVCVSLGLSCLRFALLLESVGLCVLLHREFSSIIFQALLSHLFFSFSSSLTWILDLYGPTNLWGSVHLFSVYFSLLFRLGNFYFSILKLSGCFSYLLQSTVGFIVLSF